MKASEIRGRSREDIEAQIAELQRRLFSLNLLGHQKEKSDVKEKLKIRRDIARCRTILRQMESQAPAAQ